MCDTDEPAIYTYRKTVIKMYTKLFISLSKSIIRHTDRKANIVWPMLYSYKNYNKRE